MAQPPNPPDDRGGEHDALQRRYAESEARFAGVFRLAPCVMVITRLSDHTILDVNEAFVHASGYPRTAVIGLPQSQFPWWQDTSLRDRILGDIGTKGYLSNVETRLIDSDGREHVTLLSGQRISMDGEPCVVWQSIEITDKVRAQEEKRALEERLLREEKLTSLGLLAGGIAHDFNNLLVGVLGNAEAALLQVPASSPAHSLLRAVVTAGERAAELTRELLDYAGRGNARLAPLEALTLLWETADLVRATLPSNVVVRLESSEMHLWVEGDSSQLRRLFMNLIKNGAEACGGAPGQVLISANSQQTADGELVCIRIHDTGHGMDGPTRERVFEPFFSTKASGHGLGLAAVQGIAQNHRGSIEVTSAPGEGTTFVVKLPRCKAPAFASRAEAHVDFQGTGELLLIDDDAGVRATTTMLLELHGFAVTSAPGGEAGLALLAATPDRFRAVVLDSTMPGIDGAATLRRLRSTLPTLPVLLCSGYTQHDLASSLGADPHAGFVGKPFRRHELLGALRALLTTT